MESIFATSKQYRCIIISPKTLFYVKIEKSPLKKKKVSKIIVSATIIHALLPGQIFLPFCFFSLSSIFLPFLLILSIHLSFFFFSFFFFLYVVVVVVVTYIFL